MAVTVKLWGKLVPYKWQKHSQDVITDILSGKQREAMTLVIKAARQRFGKSGFVKTQLIRFACQIDRSENRYVAPDLGLSRKMFKEIRRACRPIIRSSNAQTLEIEFINGSTIFFHSEAQGEGLRGYTVKGLLVIDEGSSFKDTTYYELINPWTEVHSALTIIVSTPKAETGFFFDSYNKGLGDNPYYITLDWVKDFGSLCPISPKNLSLKSSIPMMKWINEYEGEFAKARGQFFGDFSKCLISVKNLTEALEQVDGIWIGIDCAGGNGGDYTVLTAMNENKDMLFTWKTNTLSPTEQIEAISEILTPLKAKIKKITVEYNGLGHAHYELFRQKGWDVTKFNTTASSKRKILDNLQIAVQKKTVGILNDPDVVSQFTQFESVTKDGKTTYRGANNTHDDIVMSVAICYDSIGNTYKHAILTA